MKDLHAFGDQVAGIAIRAAQEYLRQHSLTVDPKALSQALREQCKIRLPEAMQDAREAMDAHMPQQAELTLRLSMAQAGIEAARQACGR